MLYHFKNFVSSLNDETEHYLVDMNHVSVPLVRKIVAKTMAKCRDLVCNSPPDHDLCDLLRISYVAALGSRSIANHKEVSVLLDEKAFILADKFVDTFYNLDEGVGPTVVIERNTPLSHQTIIRKVDKKLSPLHFLDFLMSGGISYTVRTV